MDRAGKPDFKEGVLFKKIEVDLGARNLEALVLPLKELGAMILNRR